MPADRSQLSARARKLLDDCGVNTPEQLHNPPKGWRKEPKDVLFVMSIGREIVEWARLNGVQYGPSAEWLALFDAAAGLPLPCRQALWRSSLATENPNDCDPEDIVMEIITRTEYQDQFRAWALKHAACFGKPKLHGISPRLRKLLRRAGFSQATEVARRRRSELRSASDKLGPKTLDQVALWLKGQGLAFLEDEPWLASLSTRANKALERLNIRDSTDLQRLRSSDFVNLKNCGTKTVAEIRQWARARGREIPE